MRRATRITAAIIVVLAAAIVTSSSSARFATPIPPPPPTPMTQIAYFGYHTDHGIWCYDIFLINAAGGAKVDITHNDTIKTDTAPNWSPDGYWIAFSRTYQNGGSDIIVVSPNRKGEINLTGGPSLAAGVQNLHPTWSADGKWIVYSSNRDGNFDLYRVPVFTPSVLERQLTRTSAPVQNLDPDYAPVGDMIAFSRVVPRPTGTAPSTALLMTMKAQPGAPAYGVVKPTSGHGALGPAWSPNGMQIAFYADFKGNDDVFVVNADGSDLARITSSAAPDLEPTWSPDGFELAFLSERSGDQEIWAQSLVSAGFWDPPARQITFDQAKKGAPDWQSIPTNSDG